MERMPNIFPKPSALGILEDVFEQRVGELKQCGHQIDRLKNSMSDAANERDALEKGIAELLGVIELLKHRPPPRPG